MVDSRWLRDLGLLNPQLSTFDHQPFHDFLAQREVLLFFDAELQCKLVGLLVRLRTGAVHCGAFAAIEHAELDAGFIDNPAHFAAERVDLAHDLSLGDAADGRVATHLADGIAVHCEQGGVGSHSRGSQRRLNAGVSGADDNDVVVVDTGRHALEFSPLEGAGAVKLPPVRIRESV